MKLQVDGGKSAEAVNGKVPEVAENQDSEPTAMGASLEIEGTTLQHQENPKEEKDASNTIQVDERQPYAIKGQVHGRNIIAALGNAVVVGEMSA